MRLVCHTLSLESFSEEDAIQILAKSGFDAIDWSFFRMKNSDDVWNQENWRERIGRYLIHQIDAKGG